MKTSKAKRVRNIAPPKSPCDKAPDFTEHQRAVIAVAVRESKVELLDNLIVVLTHLRAEVI